MFWFCKLLGMRHKLAAKQRFKDDTGIQTEDDAAKQDETNGNKPGLRQQPVIHVTAGPRYMDASSEPQNSKSDDERPSHLVEDYSLQSGQNSQNFKPLPPPHSP